MVRQKYMRLIIWTFVMIHFQALAGKGVSSIEHPITSKSCAEMFSSLNFLDQNHASLNNLLSTRGNNNLCGPTCANHVSKVIRESLGISKNGFSDANEIRDFVILTTRTSGRDTRETGTKVEDLTNALRLSLLRQEIPAYVSMYAIKRLPSNPRDLMEWGQLGPKELEAYTKSGLILGAFTRSDGLGHWVLITGVDPSLKTLNYLDPRLDYGNVSVPIEVMRWKEDNGTVKSTITIPSLVPGSSERWYLGRFIHVETLPE